MMIVERIAKLAREKAGQLYIRDIRLGVGYTGVQLSNGSCGVAYTFRNDLGANCGVMENAGRLKDLPAEEAAAWAMDLNLAKASAGIAAINALLNEPYTRSVNAMDMMDIRPEDTVGMIGYFHPVVMRFGEKCKKLHIFERKITSPGLLPDWAENILLPQCDVVIITGTTLINKTIDHVLSLCKNAKEIAIMGPSACMAPNIFKEYGVTLLAGSKVTDAAKVMEIISQGGGGQDVLDVTQKICVRLEDRRNG